MSVINLWCYLHRKNAYYIQKGFVACIPYSLAWINAFINILLLYHNDFIDVTLTE